MILLGSKFFSNRECISLFSSKLKVWHFSIWLFPNSVTIKVLPTCLAPCRIRGFLCRLFSQHSNFKVISLFIGKYCLKLILFATSFCWDGYFLTKTSIFSAKRRVQEAIPKQ